MSGCLSSIISCINVNSIFDERLEKFKGNKIIIIIINKRKETNYKVDSSVSGGLRLIPPLKILGN